MNSLSLRANGVSPVNGHVGRDKSILLTVHDEGGAGVGLRVIGGVEQAVQHLYNSGCGEAVRVQRILLVLLSDLGIGADTTGKLVGDIDLS